jgi:hypothetical protein
MGGSAAPSRYAMCATQHLSAAGQPTTSIHPLMGTGADLSVGCSAGDLLAGGGAHEDGIGTITGLTADNTAASWLAHIKVSGAVGGPPTTYNVTDYAICVTVS